MGNPAIILSLSDPAGQTIFNVLKNKGFKNTKVPWIFQYRNISLIIVEPLIVPEVRYMNPQEPKPYPADIDRIAKENNQALQFIQLATLGKQCTVVIIENFN
jgi:hypothetical protein